MSSLQSASIPQTAETAGASPGRRRSRIAPTWRRLALRSLWLVLFFVPSTVIEIIRANPVFAQDVYVSGIFPAIRGAVSSVFSIFPFSFAEVLAAVLVAALAVFVAFCIVQAVRKKLDLRRFVGWLLTIGIIGAAGYNAFYWMWGFNYYTEPISSRMGLTVEGVSTEELEILSFTLAQAANTLREELQEDEQGVFRYKEGKNGILKKIPQAYAALGESETLFSTPVPSAKPVAMSELLSDAGISGIFIPFTEEANVNVAGTPLLIAASAAHESAHYLGVAREEEANFVAFLACLASEDPQIKYSGVMLALIYSGNALAEADSSAYSALWNTYSDEVRRDLAANNAHVQEHKGPVSDTVDRVNDEYLRANDQPSGVRSYGEMVDLLAAWARAREIL